MQSKIKHSQQQNTATNLRSSMQIISTTSSLRARLSKEDAIAFVPTMGNLHEGHLQLVSEAKKENACVVVSIFVNPLQFGENEDFTQYPRTLEADLAKLKSAGVEVAFTPNEMEIYPNFDAYNNNSNQTMTISPSSIAYELCGAVRPGHFTGMATIVMKLFNLVFFNGASRKLAIFGKKDFQQLHIIREMVSQFNLPIEIIAVKTMRESDSLAMSSRNAYLTASQRIEAPRLFKALTLAAESVQQGNKNFHAIETQATEFLTKLGWIVDYISIRSSKTLLPAGPNDNHLIVLGAAKQGRTRLIDNIEFDIINP
jgi:pantoate--beta-alanine ligase